LLGPLSPPALPLLHQQQGHQRALQRLRQIKAALRYNSTDLNSKNVSTPVQKYLHGPGRQNYRARSRCRFPIHHEATWQKFPEKERSAKVFPVMPRLPLLRLCQPAPRQGRLQEGKRWTRCARALDSTHQELQLVGGERALNYTTIIPPPRGSTPPARHRRFDNLQKGLIFLANRIGSWLPTAF
jgi:hypothetical protein